MDSTLYMMRKISDADLVRWKIKLTLEKIIEKSPERQDYIEPMVESIHQLSGAIECMRWMRDNLYKLQSKNDELVLQNEILRQQAMKLAKTNNELLDSIDI